LITIILTYRNRTIDIVKKCLQSLAIQTNKDFQVTLIDYGSTANFSEELNAVCNDYSFIQLIKCPTQGQLWNKARAVNLALRQCETEYLLIADIDMIFSPDFIEKSNKIKNDTKATYFLVGYLSEEESKKTKDFSEYIIKHNSTDEATGITLFPTNVLLQINGYDEFYHGWGSEDTDVHIRLKQLGAPVRFYDSEILILHQWHAKTYRSLKSGYPFHSRLERINQKYLEQSKEIKRTKANIGYEWGKSFPEKAYQDLKNPSQRITISNEKDEFSAFIIGELHQLSSCVEIIIRPHKEYKAIKNKVKKLVGKKALEFFDFEEINNRLLEMIISNFRTKPYSYKYDPEKEQIILTINLIP